jgi:hypothetical protein
VCVSPSLSLFREGGREEEIQYTMTPGGPVVIVATVPRRVSIAPFCNVSLFRHCMTRL